MEFKANYERRSRYPLASVLMLKEEYLEVGSLFPGGSPYHEYGVSYLLFINI